MRATILTLVTLTSVGAVSSGSAAPADPWGLLASVEIEEIITDDLWQAKKTFPRALRAATDGFRISGYVVPVTAEPYIATFILVEDPAGCPFCGNDGYGPVLEVQLKRPIGGLVEFDQITVEGRLELIHDPETFQSYRLLDAVPRQATPQ
eukprot:TRINITY_DN71854_c0_g1_i1.p2 TRINITY_DN71854_c0_g1~~TRINITY_DN71854_c0_g1_i1.p2  ORF type:complete len:150 (+),score=22.45 TRINITY_DN71854_c0_g1_i1:90-539(+)